MKDNFLIRITETSIKFNKRSLRTSYGVFILNLTVCLFNVLILYTNTSSSLFIGGIGIGVSGISCFWIWLVIWETRMDLRIEKEKLSWLQKRNESGITSFLA